MTNQRVPALFRIGITVGDPTGIGPEVVIKALQELTPTDEEIVLFGPREAMMHWAREWIGTAQIFDSITWVDIPWHDPSGPSRPVAAGHFVWEVLQQAMSHLQAGEVDALVTAPIIKKNLASAGYPITDHTTLLAETFRCKTVMSMITPVMRIAFYTSHIPLSEVPRELDPDRLSTTLEIVRRELIERFGIADPHIAVCGLNPHAGEGGTIGHEEEKILAPVVNRLSEKGWKISGPYPPETIFRLHARGEFDAVLALYHDQGMIPVKLLHFGETVNYTMGLPIIRTSPDHGAAPDIAGMNRASPSGFLSAFNLAVHLVRRVKNHRGNRVSSRN